MEFTPNSCSSKCPRTPIYSLGVRMGVRQNFPRSRLNGGHGHPDVQLCYRIFSKIQRRNLSCIRTSSGQDGSIVWTIVHLPQVISISCFERPDHGAGAPGRLNFNTQFPYLMRVRPYHEGETSGRLKSNRLLPYTMHQRPDHSCQTSGRSNLNCDSFLMWTRVQTGYRIVQTVD
jgi:hypothetical protein